MSTLLSLPEIERNNPAGARRGRFFCPRCQAGGGKTPDLSVDLKKGVYHCFKCGSGGRLAEERKPEATRRRRSTPTTPYARPAKRDPFFVREAPATPPNSEISEAYIEACQRDFPGSPADEYERKRGIDGVRTGMGYDARYPFLRGDSWVTEPAVVFFFYDADGKCVGKQGRMLRQPAPSETAKVSFGRVSQGVFHPQALTGEEIVLCEGPNTAAALVERGYPAVALGGKVMQDWLIDVVVDRRVWIAFDNDAPGRAAASDLLVTLEELGIDAHICHPPTEGHDWNDHLLANPNFVIPAIGAEDYTPSLQDVWAQCRRLLKSANGDLRELLEEWEYALISGPGPARSWWQRNSAKLQSTMAYTYAR